MPAYEYAFDGELVRLNDVRLTLGGREILSGVTATIRNVTRPGLLQGQIVAFLGPSGVGKSQTCRVLTGLQAPTSGTVLVGKPPVPVREGLVGYVMQHYPLFRNLSVMQNLIVAGQQAGLSGEAAKEKAEALLTRFDLLAWRGLYPAQLSGGQRQRVAICQQLMCSEHYLVMDEPFSGLDPVSKDKACALIQEVASLNEETTIIVVTHDVRSAVSISDTVWLMGRDKDAEGNPTSGGKIIQEIDLKERELAWRPDNHRLPAFDRTVQEIEARFRTL